MFKDKVVLITGSRRGIGLAIAQEFAKAGANVVITATSQEGCDQVAKSLQDQYGVKAIGIKVDVANKQEVQNLVDKVMQEFGRIDILVNNAGITKDNLFLRMDETEWLDVMNTNLNSVFYCTKAVIRSMLKQKFGRIINISSIVGLMGNVGQANYATAKAGMIGFTKSIAKEFGRKGITCNAVAPGFIETDMISKLPQEYLNSILELVPQRRLGQPSDVAQLVLFLASDNAAYITGQVVQVDGGLLM